MIYDNIFNPSHRTFDGCLDYILRSDTTVNVSRRVVSFHGAGGDLDKACEIAAALAPLAIEHGTHARPRTRPWRHSIMSLPENEDLSDATMLDITVEATRKLGTSGKGLEPDIPMIVAVHRDTDNLHSHILSVPVDLNSLARVRAPHSIQTYRSVLAPIEERLGLSAPKAIGRWDGKRFNLPFKTWVKMDQNRLDDIRGALVSSTTWEECMRRLAVHGVKFRETGPSFSSTTKYFLAPFGSKRRLDEGMSIQRDVFAGCRPAPTAASIVNGWGRFPRDYQNRLEAAAPKAHHFVETTIGGKRGRKLYKRWEDYAAHKQGQREILARLFAKSLDEARAKDESRLSDYERNIVADPKRVRAEIMDGAAPMRFADWIESMADKRDRDAQWLRRLAADGANVDPLAAKKAEAEGDAQDSGAGNADELEIARRTWTKLEKERLNAALAKSKEREAKRRAERDASRKSKGLPATLSVKQQMFRPPPLAQRGAILESLL